MSFFCEVGIVDEHLCLCGKKPRSIIVLYLIVRRKGSVASLSLRFQCPCTSLNQMSSVILDDSIGVCVCALEDGNVLLVQESSWLLCC